MHSDEGLFYKMAHTGLLGMIRKNEFYQVNRLTAPLFERLTFASVLDVGAGDGTYFELFPERFKVYGCDFYRSPAILQLAYEDFFCQDFFSLDEVERYDVITCLGVLEFIQNIEEALVKLSSLLKPHGKLILMTPSWLNDYSLYKWMSNFFGNRDIQALSCSHLKKSPFKIIENYFVFPHNELFILGKKN